MPDVRLSAETATSTNVSVIYQQTAPARWARPGFIVHWARDLRLDLRSQY